jgi:RNA polymerase sigma factor for flagellar operon FliA
MSAGIFGLMDAVNAFDPLRGVKFETYCAPRIRGAILDELRSMDWVPRLVRSRAHKLNEATQSLEAQFGRKPEAKELAKEMKVSLREFHKIERDAHATGLVSLSRKWFETDSHKDVREIDVLEDKKSEDPFRTVQKKDLKDLVTKGLSRAERLIIILYYFEEMTMKEIGETLDLSESRVSQMHSAVLTRLRHQLEKQKKELQTA